MADVVAPPGFFRITDVDTGVATAGRLGETPPTLSGGTGGVSIIARPNRAPITSERGDTPERRLTIDVLFDAWRSGDNVENAIENLERLASSPAGSSSLPVVQVSGQMPRTDLEWIIDAIEYGDAIWNDGVRVRQAATITLVEYVVGALLITTPAIVIKPRRAEVRPGDNLKKMAARLLGNANRWREIARLNGRETYTLTKATVGTFLKVPPR